MNPMKHQQSESAEPHQSLSRVTRSSHLAGYGVAAIFFLGFGGWAALVPLSSAAVAPGVVSPDGYRKTVQHLEGGIIRTINVQEGQEVRRGDTLVTLQGTKALADYQSLLERVQQLLATEARLVAEQDGQSAILFPPDLKAAGRLAHDAMIDQAALFASRRAARHGREQILDRRVAQLREENRGIEDIILAQGRKAALIKHEIADVRFLQEKGLARMPRLLELERAQVDIGAERAQRKADLARNKQKIGETEIQRITLNEQDREAVSKELAQVRADLAVARSQMPSRADVLRRTIVQAPISGRILEPQDHHGNWRCLEAR